jgi:hypothetical protein
MNLFGSTELPSLTSVLGAAAEAQVWGASMHNLPWALIKMQVSEILG